MQLTHLAREGGGLRGSSGKDGPPHDGGDIRQPSILSPHTSHIRLGRGKGCHWAFCSCSCGLFHMTSHFTGFGISPSFCPPADTRGHNFSALLTLASLCGLAEETEASKLAFTCPPAETDNLATHLRLCTRPRDAIVCPLEYWRCCAEASWPPQTQTFTSPWKPHSSSNKAFPDSQHLNLHVRYGCRALRYVFTAHS